MESTSSDSENNLRLSKKRLGEIAVIVLVKRLQERGYTSFAEYKREIPKIAALMGGSKEQILKQAEVLELAAYTIHLLVIGDGIESFKQFEANETVGTNAIHLLVYDIVQQEGVPSRNDLKRGLPNKAKQYGIPVEETKEFMTSIMPSIIMMHLGCDRVSLHWSDKRFLEE